MCGAMLQHVTWSCDERGVRNDGHANVISQRHIQAQTLTTLFILMLLMHLT